MLIAENTIAQKIHTVLADDDNIVAVYLFGSVAQGKAHRQSDVDVAILFAESLDTDEIFTRTLAIGTALEGQLEVPVDVIALNRASIFLRFQVIKTGQLLFERNRTQRCLFQMKVMNAYYDAKPYLDYQRSAMIRRIFTEGLGHGYHGNRNALTEVRKLRQTLAPTPTGTSG